MNRAVRKGYMRLVKLHPDGQRFAVQNGLAGRFVEPWSRLLTLPHGEYAKKPEREFRFKLLTKVIS